MTTCALHQILLAPPPPKVLVFQNSTFTLADGTTLGFTDCAIGTAAPNRYVIFGVRGAGAGIGTATGGSVGGVAATVATTIAQGSNSVGVCIAGPIPSGTTATITATFSAQSLRTGIAWWTVTGLTAVAALASGISTASPGSTTITVRQGGFAVGIMGQNNVSTTAWTNLTERSETNDGDGAMFSSADSDGVTANGTRDISCTYSVVDTNRGMIAVSWG